MSPKLWMEASENFVLPGYSNRERSQRWASPKLRAIFWPSGKICWQINMYLLASRKTGLTVSTVNTYASELSIFARFLYHSEVQIQDVDDDVLLRFSDYLLQGKRSGNHVNRLLQRALRYLIWFQQVFPGAKLIGVAGDGCNVTVGFVEIGAKRGSIAHRMRHMSMVPTSTPRTIRPISYSDVLKLVAACKDLGASTFRKSRDRCIVTLLADSGMRREELTWIQCSDIKEAIVNGFRLRVRTSKRKGNPLREIPVPKLTLEVLDQFIDVQRAIHMRRLKRRLHDFVDAGWLFCSYGGRKLAPVSLTQIFNQLRECAGIQGAATPHMLRHRYITLQVMTRIKALQHSNVGLEMLSTILSQVASLSGHSSVDSLWTYVDWAFEELDISDEQSGFDYSNAIGVLDELTGAARKTGDAKVVRVLESCMQLLKKQSDGPPQMNAVSHSMRKGLLGKSNSH